ncbi:hypothetical protein QBC39DRAFT_42212 [Podospora conica]|nr:hypothetical protein QBC39DRAFT_42212 [Schizothecium conicum]
MASHDDEQQPLHPSHPSILLADRQKERRGGVGGAGKPAEFQISRKKAWPLGRPFLQNSQFSSSRCCAAGCCSVVVGNKKGETSRRPGSCFTILVAPPPPTVSALVSFWIVSSTSCRDSLTHSLLDHQQTERRERAKILNKGKSTDRKVETKNRPTLIFGKHSNRQNTMRALAERCPSTPAQLHRISGADIVDVAPAVFSAHHHHHHQRRWGCRQTKAHLVYAPSGGLVEQDMQVLVR